jgi:hypothetical protein
MSFHIYPETLIQEAIDLSAARALVKQWPTGDVTNQRLALFSNLERLPSATRSRNKYRVYVPYDQSQIERKIQDALTGSGYEIKSYAEGQATDKRGRIIGLGKVFNILKRPDLEKLYSTDIMSRDLQKQSVSTLLVFSYHPYDIAGMSTGRSWTSCMTIATPKDEGGVNSHYVSEDMIAGTFICYLVASTDTNIQSPYARVLIKPFINTLDPSQILFVPERRDYSSGYGGGTGAFIRTVGNIINDAQDNEYVGKFRMDERLYCDSGQREVVKHPGSTERYESPLPLPTTVEEVERRVRDLIALDVLRHSDYTITPDLKVKLEKSQRINFTGDTLQWSQLPVQFAASEANVGISLYLDSVPITTLAGSPPTVQDFDLFNLPLLTSLEEGPSACELMAVKNVSRITSLRGAPQSVKILSVVETGITSLLGLGQDTESMHLDHNYRLISLRGCPEKMRYFNLDNSPITSLQGSPNVVGTFYIRGTKLTSLVGGPRYFTELYHCYDPLETYDGSPMVKDIGKSRISFHTVVSPKTKSFQKLPSYPRLDMSLLFKHFPSSSLSARTFFLEDLLRFREEGKWDASVPMDEFTKLWSTFPFDIELRKLDLVDMPLDGGTITTAEFKRVFPHIQEVRIHELYKTI